jgi:hypothetical protein
MYTLELPDKASDLIEVALTELERVEADERYRVDMGLWHKPIPYTDQNIICLVCFAGAVMSRVLPLDTDGKCNLFSPETNYKLHALDHFRAGNVDLALETMGISERARDCLPYQVGICMYKMDPQGFKKQMKGLVDLLRSKGF